jgi:lipopolysaccharide export LptBFGC system permease protein LptF
VLLQRYVLRQLLQAFALSVGGMTFIALPGITVSAVHKLGGVGLKPLLDYLPLVLADLVPYILPIGFLLAVVSTYGRLAADNEWTAICMARISPLRMLTPAFGLSLLVGVAVFYLVSNVGPGLASRIREFRTNTVLTMMKTLSPGRTELRFPGGGYMNARYREGNVLRDVILDLPGRGKEERLFAIAERAEFRVDDTYLTLALDGAKKLDARQEFQLGHVDIVRELASLTGSDRPPRRSWRYLKSGRLAQALERGEIPAKEQPRARLEYHNRMAVGCTAILFCLVGAPTGLFFRRGSGLTALAIGVAYALAYYLLSMRLGRALVNSGAVPEWLAAWAATMAGSVLGLYLTSRAIRR